MFDDESWIQPAPALFSVPLAEPAIAARSSFRHASGSGVPAFVSVAQSSDASPTYMRVLPAPRSTTSNSVRSPVVSPLGLLGFVKSFWFIVWKTCVQLPERSRQTP